jgi:hypothetical protein
LSPEPVVGVEELAVRQEAVVRVEEELTLLEYSRVLLAVTQALRAVLVRTDFR